MPWKVIDQMKVKIEFIKDRFENNFSIVDLCQKYGISRPTAAKWLKRYAKQGVEGLKEQSRAPKNCPHKTSAVIADLLIKEKLKNRKRGPRKVRAQVKRQYPELTLPAISTISDLF